MKRRTKLYFLLILVCYIGQTNIALAGHQVANDTTIVQKSSFDSTLLDDFRNDSDFQYGEITTTSMSLWDRIKLMIGLWLSRLFSLGGNSIWGKILAYVLCISVIIYTVFKLLKVDIRHVFYRSHKKPPLQYRSIHDDIHVMDFEALIKDAVKNGNYREAVRLIYLAALKQLTDHDHLQWKVGKTNHEYMDELSSTIFQKDFDQLSYYFEYSWYGQFTVDQSLYTEVSEKYQSLTQKL